MERWSSEGKDDGEFRRVPKSGGWDKRLVSGDIMGLKRNSLEEEDFSIDTSFPFSVECKNWRDENVKHFVSGLYSADSQMFEWMEQAVDDIIHTKKIPMVIFKLFRTENIFILRAEDFSKIKESFGEPDFKLFLLRRYNFETNWKSNSLVFGLLDNLIEWIDWDVYKMKRFIRSFKDDQDLTQTIKTVYNKDKEKNK